MATGEDEDTVSLAGDPDTARQKLYLLPIATANPGGPAAVQSVTGHGLTWNRVDIACGGDYNNHLEVWVAIGVASSTDITITFQAMVEGYVVGYERYSNATGVVAADVATSGVGVEFGCPSSDTDTNYTTTASINGANNLILTFVAYDGDLVTHIGDSSQSSHFGQQTFWDEPGANDGTLSLDGREWTYEGTMNTTISGTFDAPAEFGVVTLTLEP